MIAESPRFLLMCLAATTVLGAVMGYCVALLRAKSRAREAINSVRIELGNKSDEAETQLDSVRQNIVELQGALSRQHERANKSVQREESLELHSQLQAKRITTLDVQLANYKSNKSNESELAGITQESRSKVDGLPILSKRIDAAEMAEPTSPHPLGGTRNQVPRAWGQAGASLNHWQGERGRLNTPLSRELYIPALSESELPDSEGGLEFELADMDGTGAWSRG